MAARRGLKGASGGEGSERPAPPQLEIVIDGADDFAVISARGAARELAREMGFGIVDQTRISAAVSEIVRNAVLYAGRGKVRFIVHGDEPTGEGWPPHRPGIEIVVTDEGPGIPDLDSVLAGGVSTSGGFGRGIAGSRALMDEFEIMSTVGKGTTVRMCKWLT
jgi:serine/threonine-protein kinase RsbT